MGFYSIGYAWASLSEWLFTGKSPLAGLFDVLEPVVTTLLLTLAKLAFTLAGGLMMSMGTLLDYALVLTMDSSLINGLSIIDVGWTLTRDVANLFFIFILLYIAIQTILGVAGHSTKTLLRNVIIIALLINFSLFLTKVVIDAANILALSFYWKVETVLQTPNGAQTVNGPSHALMEGLQIQTLYANGSPSDPAGLGNLDQGKQIMIYLGGTVLMFITAYVFLVGMVMMVYRTIVLIFCMIFAPLAFLGYILPKAGTITSKWWDALIGNAFVAPVFTFLIYLVIVMIRSKDLFKLSGAENKTFSSAIGDLDPRNFEIIINYFILISMLIGVLVVSRSVSSGAANFATKWAGRGGGFGAAGLAVAGGVAGRQVLGRAGRWIAESERVNKLAARKDGGVLASLGRGLKTTGDVAQKSSFDVRNTRVGTGLAYGLGFAGMSPGAGSKKNYERSGGGLGTRFIDGNYKGTEKEEAEIKILKERYKNNPVALEAALQSRFGIGAEQYKSPRYKELREETGRKVATQGKKDRLKESLSNEDYEARKKNIAELEERKRRGEGVDAELTSAKEKLAAAVTQVADDLRVLNGREFAELNPQEVLSKKIIQENATSDQIRALYRHDSEKGYSDPTLLPAFATSILASKNTAAQSTLRSLAKQNPGAFGLDFEGDVEKLVKEYSKKDAATRAAAHSSGTGTNEEYYKREVGKTLGYLGDGKDLQDWDEELLNHELVVSKLNKQHLQALSKSLSLSEDRFESLTRAIEANGSDAAKRYVREAKGDNPFAKYAAPRTAPSTAAPSPSVITIPHGSRTAGPLPPPATPPPGPTASGRGTAPTS